MILDEVKVTMLTLMLCEGCRGHDRMVVGFTTTCAMMSCHH